MRVNVYIRKDDEPLWNAIKDKPAWLHERLNGGNPPQLPIRKEKPVKQPAKRSKGVAWCKQHDIEKDFCKGFKHDL